MSKHNILGVAMLLSVVIGGVVAIGGASGLAIAGTALVLTLWVGVAFALIGRGS